MAKQPPANGDLQDCCTIGWRCLLKPRTLADRLSGVAVGAKVF
ncbi:MAG: hypothetical protein QM520_04005 [Gammaproteobacteria bacterium]|nr:hypothetical protein [Gammaproteobacteria bacterium]